MIRLANHWRWWASILGVFGALSAAGPWVNRAPYDAPAFDTIRRMAPWGAWSTIWLLVSVCCFAAALTRCPRLWRMGVISSVWVGFSWLSGVTYEYLIDGASVSLTALGLWLVFCVGNFLVATSSNQFVQTGNA